MRIKITALALAAVLPFATVQAADNSQQGMQGRWQQGQQNWTQELKLNDSQQQQFQHKREAYRADQQKQREQFREQQKKQHEAFQKKQQSQRERHHADLRKLLTPEQRVQFDRKTERMTDSKVRPQPPRNAKHSAQYKQDKRGPKHSMHGKRHAQGKPMHGGHRHSAEPAPQPSRALR